MSGCCKHLWRATQALPASTQCPLIRVCLSCCSLDALVFASLVACIALITVSLTHNSRRPTFWPHSAVSRKCIDRNSDSSCECFVRRNRGCMTQSRKHVLVKHHRQVVFRLMIWFCQLLDSSHYGLIHHTSSIGLSQIRSGGHSSCIDQLHDSLWQQLGQEERKALRLASKAKRLQAGDRVRTLTHLLPNAGS